MDKLFNVCQFFENEDYEYVRRNVYVAEAIAAFRHYITSVGAKMGFTRRVIVTDMGDCIVAEWIFKKGIVYPPELVGKPIGPEGVVQQGEPNDGQ